MQSLAAEISLWHHAVKVLAALSGLMGAFFLGTHFLKRYRASRLAAPSLIRILETHYLTPKITLYLVAVGPARFLLGNTGDRLTLLTVLPPTAPGQAESPEVPCKAG